MNLEAHYQSYREQVQLDAFPGYAEYAAASVTADPQAYPTVLDYLKHITSCVKQAIAKNDPKEYVKSLAFHQEAILALFRRMFEDRLDPFMDRSIATMDLVNALGWRSFKFSSIILEFETFVAIPLYHTKFKDQIYGSLPCFNADEIHAVTDAMPSGDIMDTIFSAKKDKSYVVCALDDDFRMEEFATRNYTVVNDWTGRLN